MAEFDVMLKVLGEIHNAEVLRYKNENANLQNELERCKNELSIAIEEMLKQNEVFERTKIKLSMKSQETRQLRDLLLKYDVSVPPTDELVDTSQKIGPKKAEAPLISTSTPSSSTIPVSSLSPLTTPVFTTVQDCVSVVTPTTSTHCSTCVTHCTMTSSIISSCATENNQASSGFINAISSPRNRKALKLHRRKKKIIYGLQKIRNSSRNDNKLRVGRGVDIESISLSEDGSYNQDKNSISPENQTKDSICNDDKPDTFTSNFTTERNIIPPTPWVRPKTSLTSGRQKQLLDSGRATEIETISGGDVTRASLDETVDLFSEPSQSEEEASS